MNASFVRAKRVTHLLDEKAKARLVSTNDLESYDPNNTPCLSKLVHDFLETESDHSDNPVLVDSECVDSAHDSLEFMERQLRSYITNNADDPYKLVLSLHVTKAVESFACFRPSKSYFMHKVKCYLRDAGHNASVCKTKWDSSSSGGAVAGNYEFIEVLHEHMHYVVDIEFAAEFEIARPSERYVRMLKILPRVLVLKSDELKRVVKLMCDEAKKSMKCKELCLPPWRKNRYMQNKWFGPCVRPASSDYERPLTGVNGVDFRWVEFNNGLNNHVSVRSR